MPKIILYIKVRAEMRIQERSGKNNQFDYGLSYTNLTELSSSFKSLRIAGENETRYPKGPDELSIRGEDLSKGVICVKIRCPSSLKLGTSKGHAGGRFSGSVSLANISHASGVKGPN